VTARTDVREAFAGHAHTTAVLASLGLVYWGELCAVPFGPTMCEGGVHEANDPALVALPPSLSDPRATVSSEGFSCFLASQGTRRRVACFGLGDDGRLGIADVSDHLAEAVLVTELSVADPVSVDLASTGGCALGAFGEIGCWGGAPRPGPLVSGVAALALGASHGCLALSTGRVVCSGRNSEGQLGDGSTSDRTVFARGIADRAVELTAGANHVCALSNDRTVACFGDASHGQLGNGSRSPSPSPVPVRVSGLADVAGLASSGNHTCAFTVTGDVLCWGDNDLGGLDSAVPLTVSDLGVATAVATGDAHTCAIVSELASRQVYCWGDDSYGQLGNPDRMSSAAPVLVKTIARADDIASRGITTCIVGVVGANAGVHCWGEPAEEPALVPMPGGRRPMTVEVGTGHQCALLEDGTVACWGENEVGQLGRGTTSAGDPTPALVPGLFDVLLLALGARNACARTTVGDVHCWGANDAGQHGVGDLANNPSPEIVPLRQTR
jgi:hypothetical protein